MASRVVGSLAGGDLKRRDLKRLGKYEILGELGRGAMGVVYQGRDPIIGRMVALKTITANLEDNPNLLERFYREAQSAGGLQHPNIVTIYNMGEEGGLPYIAMELIEGRNLEQIITSAAPLPMSLKLGYGVQACRALDYAHKRGIIHRDIKPSNIMVTKEGTVKVVDFGLARVLETQRTQTGMLIGTFAYMSPEQYNGTHADERSDIWSFGVLLYELLSAKKPFTAENPVSLMQAICSNEPRPLCEIAPDCSRDVEAIVHRMLRKSASERFQNMEDVLLAIAPICKTLQLETVSDLVTESRRLFEERDYSHARDTLRQALQVDSTNTQARSLLEKVNAELKRIAVRPKAQQCVDKGHALLDEGKLQEARVEVEAALRLDSAFEPAQQLQKQVQRSLDRAQVVAEWLQASKQRLAEGLPDEADALLAKILEAEPDNNEAHSLQRQIILERAERENRLRLFERMQQARSLWTQQSFAECIKLLMELQAEFRDEAEVTKLLEAVREDQAEQQKQQTIGEARRLLAAQQFEECIRVLAVLEKEMPADPEVRKLLESAHGAQAEQNKQRGLAEARMLLAKKHYDECITLLSGLQKQFPREEEVGKLLNATREDRAQEEKRQKLEDARSLLASQRFAECAALLTLLKKQFPQDSEPARLLEATRRAETELRKRESLAKARNLLTERRFEDCLSLVTQLQKEFPRESEVEILLATLGEEKSEQEKKQRLTEARGHLAAQRYAEALAVLEALLKAHPKDAAVSKLRKLVLQEQEEKGRLERLQQERGVLKRLVNEKKYREAIARAEGLLEDFPGDHNLARLVEFARNQQVQIDQQVRLRELVSQAEGLLKSADLDAALRTAESGLKDFPGNIDLVRLRGEAERQRKERETRKLIEQRVREIRAQINRQNFSDAVSLARETLSTFGPDREVNQLLSSAEVELHEQERKLQGTRRLDTIQILLSSGRLGEATETLQEALDSEVINSFDPRVRKIQEEIQAAKVGAAPPSPLPKCEPTKEPAREYALFERLSATSPTVPITEGAAQATAPQAATAPHTPTVQPLIAPPSIQGLTDPAAPSVDPSQPLPIPGTATPLPALPRTTAAHPPAAVTVPDLLLTAKTPDVSPRSGSVSLWKRSGAVGAVLVGGIILAWVAWHRPKPSVHETNPDAGQIELLQRQAIDSADKLVAAGRFEEALQVLQHAAAPGQLNSEIDKKVAEVQKAIQNQQLRTLLQQEETVWQQALSEVARGSFSAALGKIEQILALPEGGRHRADAVQLRDVVIPRRQREEQLFSLAQKTHQKGDKDSLLRAGDLYGQVMALGGPRQAEAQQSQKEVNARIQAFENHQSRQQQVASLEKDARLDLQRGDFRSSRQKATQIRTLGEDPSFLIAEIDGAERRRFDQLVSVYNNLKQRDDDDAVQQLKALQPQFQTLANEPAPLSGEAASYAANIPGAIGEVQARAQKRSTDAAFQQMVQRYQQAVSARDKNGLVAARTDFQSIVRGGGPHADDAQKYLVDVNSRLAAFDQPSAPPAKPLVNADTPRVATAVDGNGDSAIRNAIQRYAQAFNQKDADALRQVWPGMGARYQGFKSAFDAASSIRMRVDVESFILSADGASAVVKAQVSQDYKPKGAKPNSRTDAAVFHLAKSNGAWIITDVQ